MFEFNHTLHDGREVRIVNQAGISWGYEVYTTAGDRLGTIWIDGDNGTEDAQLKLYEAELVDVILKKTSPEL